MAKHRKGFLLTNGSGCYIVKKEEKNEIEERLQQGWHIALIRPICTSMAIKLKYLPPEILQAKIYSYSLCILEKEGATANSVTLPVGSPGHKSKQR